MIRLKSAQSALLLLCFEYLVGNLEMRSVYLIPLRPAQVSSRARPRSQDGNPKGAGQSCSQPGQQSSRTGSRLPSNAGASGILNRIGFTMMEAMGLLMRRLIIDQKLPFEVIGHAKCNGVNDSKKNSEIPNAVDEVD